MNFSSSLQKPSSLFGAATIFFTVITAEAADRFVDLSATGTGDGLSWANAATKLQDALVSATSGDTIHVATGTYYPDETSTTDTNDRTSTFQLKTGVAILGGFPSGGSTLAQRDIETHITTLSGDIDQNDNDGGDNSENSHHVITGTGTDSTTTLDGFTITEGNADGDFPNSFGGGLFNNGSGSPTITHCIFQNNQSSEGGAIYNLKASPAITNCFFLENRGSGNYTGNDGGAVYNEDSSPTFTNCSFQGNRASNGGAIYNKNASTIFIQCSFQGNGTSVGGGVYNDNSSPSFTNCSFQGNHAPSGGGAMHNEDSTPSLTNCIIWNNLGSFSPTTANTKTAGSSVQNNNSSPNYNYCLIANHSKTTLDNSSNDSSNNLEPSDPAFVLEVNPLFQSSTGGDLRLSYGSAAIDAGDSSANDQLTDFDGLNRTVDDIATVNTGSGTVSDLDLGAYEYQAQYPIEITTASFELTTENIITPPSTLEFSISFYRPIQGFDNANDLLISTTNSLSYTGATLTGSGIDYVLTLTGVTGEGLFSISIKTDQGITDTIGNTIAPNTGIENLPIFSTDSPRHYVNINNSNPAAPYDTWATAATHLQDALFYVIPDDEIWVAQGIYTPDLGFEQTPGNRFATFQLKNNIALYGGFNGSETLLTERDHVANPTILSGDIDQNDNNGGDNSLNAYHVLTGSGTDGTASLNGFIITAGNANDAPSFPENVGGGLLNFGSGNPTIINCIFQNNSAVGGGAIFNREASPTIINCSFQSNSTTRFGGAIDNFGDCLPILINCSFQGNSSMMTGGAIRNVNSTPTLINCIIWNNSAFGSTDIPEASISGDRFDQSSTFSHCLIANYSKATLDNNSPDSGNNFEPLDPLFVSEVDPSLAPTTGGDLRLFSNSPALNVGDNSSNSETVDLAGAPRIQNNTIDLGAYEGAFTSFAHLGLTDPDTDDNQNGIANFLEYASGGDPSTPHNLNIRPSIDENGYQFSHRNNAIDLSFSFEMSSTLLPDSWQNMIEGIDYNILSSVDNNEQTILTLELLSAEPQHFVRGVFDAQ